MRERLGERRAWGGGEGAELTWQVVDVAPVHQQVSILGVAQRREVPRQRHAGADVPPQGTSKARTQAVSMTTRKVEQLKGGELGSRAPPTVGVHPHGRGGDVGGDVEVGDPQVLQTGSRGSEGAGHFLCLASGGSPRSGGS